MNAHGLHYTWIAVSVLSTSAHLVWSSAFLRRHPNVSIHTLMACSYGFAAVAMFPFVRLPEFAGPSHTSLICSLLAVAVLTWISRACFYYAYRRTPVANVTVFSTLTPLYACALAPYLGTPLKESQISGIALTTFGVLLFFLRGFFKRRSDGNATGAAERDVFPILCAFLSTLPSAASAYFQKDAVLLSSPLFVSAFMCLFSSLASLCYLFAAPRRTAPLNGLQPWTAVLGIAFLQAIATVAFSLFIQVDHPAVGQAAQRLSSLVQILLAHLLLRERLDTGWHLCCVALSLVGVYLMTMA